MSKLLYNCSQHAHNARLKKNQKVLKTWCNNIKSNPTFKDQALFIIDDEADASSLNTKINKHEQSTINHWLKNKKPCTIKSLFARNGYASIPAFAASGF